LDFVWKNAEKRDGRVARRQHVLEEGVMTFERGWVLLFLSLPVAWLLFEWRKTRRTTALVLKTLAFMAIVLALAEPRLTLPETKMAVAVLVDTSASVSSTDLTRASQLVSTLEGTHGRNWIRILPFARAVRNQAPQEQQRDWRVEYTAGEAGQGTDLEAAIREAVTSFPSELLPRLVLVSDGKENTGSVTRAAWQAQRLGIPIDTVALQGRSQPALRLESVTIPTIGFTGEQFPIDLDLSAPVAVSGTVEISAEGKSLGSNPVMLEAGNNQIRVHASLAAAGALKLSGVIRAGNSGEIRFDRAVTLRRPRVLYVSQDPVGTESHLMQTLTAAQFDLDRTADPMHGVLTDYQLAVFNNLDLESLPASRKDEIEKFVKQGGGLLVIGGERNLYADNKTVEDALDRTLPAKLAPPRSPEGTAVVLIIDKSSSMEGKKIELARLAAIGVVDNLRPIDTVGVLIFDNAFQWAVPIRKADDRAMIKRLISGIVPDGGTQIAPALNEAYRRVLPSRSTFKHIVLLTDGISEEGDSLDLSKEAASQHVTISTVGLGQDVNRAYLEKIAAFAAGKSYFLNEPAGLEQILLKDVSEHTGTTAVEKALHPIVSKKVEILNGIGIEDAPALKGYVRFISKPTADTILKIDQDQPLLVRWQYGLGRAVVFTSDAKSRWAADWVNWKGFDKFWANVFRDLLPHAETGEARTEYDSASGDVIVNYQLGRDVEDPQKPPAIFAFGPNGFQHPVLLTKLADKSYRGRIHVGQLEGLFRIRPLEDSRAFPEVGIYRQEQELLDYGSNEFLLRSISVFTGGRYNPTPKQIFDAQGRSQSSVLQLWPGLLGIAILLNLVELIMRKGRALFQRS
jgi:Ca-activated chloride channel family protein